MIVTAAALAPSREAASSLPPLLASAPSSFPSTASDSVPSSTVCDCLSDDPPVVPPVPRPAVPLLVPPRKLELRSSDVVEAEGLLSEETSEDVEARAERCCDVM